MCEKLCSRFYIKLYDKRTKVSSGDPMHVYYCTIDTYVDFSGVCEAAVVGKRVGFRCTKNKKRIHCFGLDTQILFNNKKLS